MSRGPDNATRSPDQGSLNSPTEASDGFFSRARRVVTGSLLSYMGGHFVSSGTVQAVDLLTPFIETTPYQRVTAGVGGGIITTGIYLAAKAIGYHLGKPNRPITKYK